MPIRRDKHCRIETHIVRQDAVKLKAYAAQSGMSQAELLRAALVSYTGIALEPLPHGVPRKPADQSVSSPRRPGRPKKSPAQE